MYMFVYAGVYKGVHVCLGQRLTLVSSSETLRLTFWDRVSHLSLEPSRAGSVWQEARDSARLCLPSPGITGVSGHSGFSDLHTSTAST